MDRREEVGIKKGYLIAQASSLFTFAQNLRADHDMLLQWKNSTKGTLSKSQQKRTTAHTRGSQFAEYSLHHVSLLNNSTGRLVITRLNKPRRWDCYSRKNGLMQGNLGGRHGKGEP
jgi:hypothetical protein